METSQNKCNPGDDGNERNSEPNDALAKALSSMLTTVIKDFDSKAIHTLKSQHQLTVAIDRLTRVDGDEAVRRMAVMCRYNGKCSGMCRSGLKSNVSEPFVIYTVDGGLLSEWRDTRQ